MLEGKDYENIDVVAPFFGEIVDIRFGNSKTAPVTDVFTQHTDLIRTIRNNSSRPGWTEEKLSSFQQQINRFKVRALVVFGQYQASNMKTSKCHVLNHVIDALMHLQSTEYLDVGV